MNPFIERGRITNPERFVGRWRELSVLFDRITTGRPVLVTGTSGIGKSSLITHVAQSAGVNLERPDMQSFYIDLGVLPDAASCYNLITQALGSKGDTAVAVEVALLQTEEPVLICLDRAESAIAAGWGVDTLERLARIVRHSTLNVSPPPLIPPRMVQSDLGDLSGEGIQRGLVDTPHSLFLVAACQGTAPTLSEPFATLGLGAFSPSEVRLLIDSYLEDTGVQFAPGEIRELTTLSAAHPAYLQRAAYHLFLSKSRTDYDWRTAYLDEARDRPIPGAPLPPAVFEGERPESILSSYGGGYGQAETRQPAMLHLTGAGDVVFVFLAVIAGLLVWQVSGNLLVGIGAFLLGIALVVMNDKRRTTDKQSTNGER